MFEKLRRKSKEGAHPVQAHLKEEAKPEVIQAKDENREVTVEKSQIVILVDASNVAHGNSVGKHEAKLSNVLTALSSLGKTGAKIITIADATLRHNIDEKDSFEKLMETREVMQVPAASSADDYIWEIAQHHLRKGNKVFVLTNDRFPITNATTAETKNIRRISFMFVDKDVFFQPSLENALKGNETDPGSKSQGDLKLRSKTPVAVEQKTLLPAKVKVEPEKKEKTAESKTEEIPPELLGHIVNFLNGRNPAVKPGDKINFASVSNYLHKKYGGNFCAVFGFKRPKDLVTLLETLGYVNISHHEKTLYIEPTAKLISR